MAISMTPNDFQNASLAMVLKGQAQDAIEVADGASVTFPATGFWRIVATSPCRVRIGTGTDANKGEVWPEGVIEVRSIVDTQTISVGAL